MDKITNKDEIVGAGFRNPVATPTAASIGAVPTSYLDTDTTLAANSDVKIPTQKATKAYADGISSTLTASIQAAPSSDQTILSNQIFN